MNMCCACEAYRTGIELNGSEIEKKTNHYKNLQIQSESNV